MITRTIVVGAVVTFTACLAMACPAQAQENRQDESSPPTLLNLRIVTPSASRPTMLPALYVGLAGLEAYDGYSTIRGVRNGAQELNPLMDGVAQQPVVFWSIKIASTGLSIYAAERLWRRHHQTEAIVLMLVTNGVMAAVGARNASVSN